MDDLLPFYAETLDEICPIEESFFPEKFDEFLLKKLPFIGKTIKNHRTENVESLLGMIIREDGLVKLSERTKQYLKDYDQPFFFKTICYKFQQPNASQKPKTIRKDIKHSLKFKPYHFILSLLKEAKKKNVILTRREVGFFVLNNLEVMQGNVGTEEVITKIIRFRKEELTFTIGNPDKSSSFNWQHIKEQFDYLKFANLIRVDADEIVLNKNEKGVINYFIEDLSKPLHFNIYKYNLDSKSDRDEMRKDWSVYFGSLDLINVDVFKTTLAALSIPKSRKKSAKRLGDEGEYFVLDYEKKQVKKFNPRLTNKS